MSPDLQAFGSLVRVSVTDPSDAARHLLRLAPPRGRVLEGAALVSVLGALLVGVADGGSMTVSFSRDGPVLSAMTYSVVLGASLLLSAGGLSVGGRILGGAGTFDQALLVVVWLNVVALVVSVPQFIVLVLAPPLAPIVFLAGLLVLLWCLVSFVRVLHGFGGVGRTLLALVLSGVAFALALTLLVSVVIGVTEMPDV